MFRKRSQASDVDEQVQRLQVTALQSQLPGEAAALYNRAGDLLLAAGDVKGAVELYGRAIDDFIEAERFDAGIALCRKLIRTAPAVVRARCTLTWLAIGAGYTADATSNAVQYTAWAEYTGREHYARRHLRRMGTVATESTVRMTVGECLLQLGDEVAADALFGEVYSGRNDPMTQSADSAGLFAQVREAALMRLATG